MSRIFKCDKIVWDLEQISAIKDQGFSNETLIYIGGQCVIVNVYEGNKVKNAWEEYIEYKESMVCPVAPLTSATASWDLR